METRIENIRRSDLRDQGDKCDGGRSLDPGDPRVEKEAQWTPWRNLSQLDFSQLQYRCHWFPFSTILVLKDGNCRGSWVKVQRNSLHYLCNFPVNLKLFQILKKFFNDKGSEG